MLELNLYQRTCAECSQLITQRYSTSFTMGIKAFATKFRMPIYSIYGFVRLADEIVDTFHQWDKKQLLDEFRVDTYRAIELGISLNPVLEAFQKVVHDYQIEHELIEAFLDSMEMDLYDLEYDQALFEKYIYGSAEVVGLMCLRVFCEGNSTEYNDLKSSARSLGSAFQKVNFLRDMKSDYEERGRLYFPGIDYPNFTDEQKATIELDIKNDFEAAYEGILKLPTGSRLGVYTAYRYYLQLLNKIQLIPSAKVKEERIRVPNQQKMYILFKSLLRHRLNLI